jgi:hypothetical protein
MRLLLAITLLSIAALSVVAAKASSLQERTTISGGGLPHALRLTAADEDAFRRRINYPPVYERTTPVATGPAYTVTSTYWEPVVVTERRRPGAVETEALYYPESGLVRARQEGEDVWLTLNLRQRAILDRYIRLGSMYGLEESPGMLELLRLAAASEQIGIQIGAKLLDANESAAFWHAVAAVERRPLDSAGEATVHRYLTSPRATDLWVIFTLEEARALRFVYEPTIGLLIDPLGMEAYTIGPNALENAIGNGAAFAPLLVAQEDSPGSLLWWPVMVGGGLALIGAAIWLRNRLA